MNNSQISAGRQLLQDARIGGLGINCYGTILGMVTFAVKRHILHDETIARYQEYIESQPSLCLKKGETEARCFSSQERKVKATEELSDFIYIDPEGRFRIK